MGTYGGRPLSRVTRTAKQATSVPRAQPPTKARAAGPESAPRVAPPTQPRPPSRWRPQDEGEDRQRGEQEREPAARAGVAGPPGPARRTKTRRACAAGAGDRRMRRRPPRARPGRPAEPAGRTRRWRARGGPSARGRGRTGAERRGRASSPSHCRTARRPTLRTGGHGGPHPRDLRVRRGSAVPGAERTPGRPRRGTRRPFDLTLPERPRSVSHVAPNGATDTLRVAGPGDGLLQVPSEPHTALPCGRCFLWGPEYQDRRFDSLDQLG